MSVDEAAVPTAEPTAADAPIFVVGFPRSGTTLLQSLIGAHPRIAAPPEMHYFVRLARHARFWGDLDDDAVARRVIEAAVSSPKFANCGFEIDRIFQRLPAAGRTHGVVFDAIMRDFANRAGKQRWCEKTPLQSASFIWGALPTAQVVHIVRDPRDSLASGLEIIGGGDIAIGARQWRQFTTRNIRAGAERGAGQYLRVRYEDLTRDPAAVLTLVFAFLGEDFDPGVLTDASRRQSVLTATVIPWQARVLEPIAPPNEGAWREKLNWHQRAQSAAILGDLLPGLGYLPPRASTMRIGAALNLAALPRDLIRRRRFLAALNRLRTPEQLYEVASRNWNVVHERTEVNDTERKQKFDPEAGIGVWLG
jgi:hypothetical protein